MLSITSNLICFVMKYHMTTSKNIFFLKKLNVLLVFFYTSIILLSKLVFTCISFMMYVFM